MEPKLSGGVPVKDSTPAHHVCNGRPVVFNGAGLQLSFLEKMQKESPQFGSQRETRSPLHLI